jgi:hypothetical protein
MNRSMNFSWKALFLAPLPLPLIVAALFTISSPGKSPFAGFLFFFALGSVLSYGTTIFLFLPCLFVVSRFTRMTASLTGLLGTLLGLVVYVPVIWTTYKSSGPDSGPPEITFLEYLRQNAFGVDFGVIFVAGLVTATLYWFLARPSSRRDNQITAP